MDRDSLAAKRFSCDERDRAIFEAGIKMGTVYHQYVGTPFNETTRRGLEEAMESAISVQPYVESVRIRIQPDDREGDDRYSYRSLTGEMIDAVVTVRIGGTAVTAEMRFDQELNYPLMFISSIGTD